MGMETYQDMSLKLQMAGFTRADEPSSIGWSSLKDSCGRTACWLLFVASIQDIFVLFFIDHFM
jgi:hypothetical protein